ncbi:hypothetical protein ACIQU3_25285 [Streptomyces sp. NPDC101110]
MGDETITESPPPVRAPRLRRAVAAAFTAPGVERVRERARSALPVTR